MPSLRRIDSHHHIVPPFYEKAAMASGVGPTRGRFPDWSPQMGIDLMDANDIQASITSVSFPGVNFFMPAKARKVARQCIRSVQGHHDIMVNALTEREVKTLSKLLIKVFHSF